MKRIFNILYKFNVTLLLALSFSDTAAAEKPYLVDIEKNRPANLWRIENSSDNTLCRKILSKLNEPHKPVERTFSYLNYLTQNSNSLKWENVSETPEILGPYKMRYDTTGAGALINIYKIAHTPTYDSSVYISRDDVLQRVLETEKSEEKIIDSLKPEYDNISFGAYLTNNRFRFPRQRAANYDFMYLDKPRVLIELGGGEDPRFWTDRLYHVSVYQAIPERGRICHIVSRKPFHVEGAVHEN